MMTTILTLILALQAGVTSLTQEFDSPAACEAALTSFRERLATGRVVLLTCTLKR